MPAAAPGQTTRAITSLQQAVWHLPRHPIDRTPADAWADFVGWRVNHEQAAHALAFAVDAAPALWSGPRRHGLSAIPPIRPPLGRHPPS